MIATNVRKTADAPNLTSRPEWRVTRALESKTPSDLTITHINQTYDLWVSSYTLCFPYFFCYINLYVSA